MKGIKSLKYEQIIGNKIIAIFINREILTKLYEKITWNVLVIAKVVKMVIVKTARVILATVQTVIVS